MASVTSQPQRAHVIASKHGLFGLIKALALRARAAQRARQPDRAVADRERACESGVVSRGRRQLPRRELCLHPAATVRESAGSRERRGVPRVGPVVLCDRRSHHLLRREVHVDLWRAHELRSSLLANSDVSKPFPSTGGEAMSRSTLLRSPFVSWLAFACSMAALSAGALHAQTYPSRTSSGSRIRRPDRAPISSTAT